MIAVDRRTGKEVWRSSDEAGYATPLLFRAHDRDQLVVWTPSHIRGLDARTGEAYWSHPYEITYGVSIAKPILQENLVFVAGYWHGSKAIRRSATRLMMRNWRGKRTGISAANVAAALLKSLAHLPPRKYILIQILLFLAYKLHHI